MTFEYHDRIADERGIVVVDGWAGRSAELIRLAGNTVAYPRFSFDDLRLAYQWQDGDEVMHVGLAPLDPSRLALAGPLDNDYLLEAQRPEWWIPRSFGWATPEPLATPSPLPVPPRRPTRAPMATDVPDPGRTPPTPRPTRTPVPSATPWVGRAEPVYLPVAVNARCYPLDRSLDVVLVIDASTSMRGRVADGRSSRWRPRRRAPSWACCASAPAATRPRSSASTTRCCRALRSIASC